MNGAVDLNNPVKYKVKGNSKSVLSLRVQIGNKTGSVS